MEEDTGQHPCKMIASEEPIAAVGGHPGCLGPQSPSCTRPEIALAGDEVNLQRRD